MSTSCVNNSVFEEKDGDLLGYQFVLWERTYTDGFKNRIGGMYKKKGNAFKYNSLSGCVVTKYGYSISFEGACYEKH